MKILYQKLRKKMGDFWWYTILLFLAQRIGDAINMFVGLWIVPKYVSQENLGAVLPLTQFVSFIGLPLGIISIPFMKYLNVYAEKGEYGKVKSLLRDVFVWTGVLSLSVFIIAYFLLPFFFERVRIASGWLGVIVVAVSIFGAVSVIFQNAVQGLKLFSSIVWFNVFSAPLRLVLMILLMPFRALGGYFIGQGAAPTVTVAGSILVLRKKLGKDITPVPYWREDGYAMLRYTLPIAVLTIINVSTASIDALVIRHRLSDFESAGYYVLTRFSDIASYLGTVFLVFLFPMVSSMTVKSDNAARGLLVKSVLGSLASGMIFAVAFYFAGDFVLGLQDVWKCYQPLASHMVWLCILNVFLMGNAAFTTYECARGKFRFLWYLVPIAIFKSASLYLLTGYTFFDGILPASLMSAVAAFDPNRLGVLLAGFILFQSVLFVFFVVDFYFEKCKSRNSPEESC